MNAPLFFCKSRARRRSIHPTLSCKVDCWMYVVFYYFRSFSSFWGLFWRAWGAFGVLLAPRGAQGDAGLRFFALFSTFGPLWEPKGRQKEPQGAQRLPKWCPKCSLRDILGHHWPQTPRKHKKPAFLDLILIPFLFNLCIGFL